MRTLKFHPLAHAAINHVVDELFHRNIADTVGNDSIKSYPAINIAEHENHFLIDVAAPGLAKEDFNIQLEKNELIISANKVKNKAEDTATTTPPQQKVTRREFDYTHFKRSFFLPENIDTDAISASYEQGVLGITVPKKVVTKTTKTVTIQ